MLSPERWRIVERLFHEALNRPPADRTGFVESGCGGDLEVKSEVESLLAAESSASATRASLAGKVASDWAGASAAPSLVGREVDGYRVLALLGAGGMGEVYLAHEPALDRRAALKLLAAPLSGDAELVRRFTEEARAASALNHPNILTVYRVGEIDGRRYIATELIAGETLRERLAREGRLSADAALDVAIQAAGALQAAHVAGIVHRDIKPENLMIREDGYVKVLDFGLAKVGTDELTGVGSVMGTLNYMAPEQARGEPVDARADLYSLSVVLHEMLTGALPSAAGAPARPPALAGLVSRGLSEDPVVRPQTAGVLRAELEQLRRSLSEAPVRRRRMAAAAALVLGVVALSSLWSRREPAAASVHSMAVLPLSTGGADDLDHLGEGIAESVIQKLSRHPTLRVIARSTAFRFKGRDAEPMKVGQELKVDAVLTGRVVPQGRDTRIEMRLVHVASGDAIWSERYVVRPGAASSVEDEIASRVSARLRLPALAGGAPMDPEAHTLYLKGRYQLNKRTPESLRQAHVLFGQALERDPQHALLHAGLADAWVLIGAYSILPPGDSFPRAIAAARQALAQDDSLAEARIVLAFCLFLHEWNWDEAEAEFRRATQMRPGYATGHHWFGEFLMGRGRTDEALLALKRAKELDPLSLVIAVDEGRALYFGHRFTEAREQCKRALDVSPGFVPAIDCLAMVAIEEGRYDDAVAGYAEVSRLWGSDSGLPGRTMALARAGRRAEAESLWAQLTARDRPGYTQPLSLALVQASLGRKDDAFRLLEVARVERANNIAYLKADPRVDSLRGDARWSSFVRQVGLD